MEEMRCHSCAHYRQHYSLDGKKLFRVYCGHCAKAKAHARSKGRKPDAPACQQYEPASPITDAFVTKEYLSKVLLEYVLALPLLSEIEDER